MMANLAELLTPAYFLTFLVILVVLILIFTNRLPTVAEWQTWLNCFETKGGQLMLLWATDMIFLTIIVHSWGGWSPTLQNTVVGVFAGVNGAFLGAVGSKNTSTNGNGEPPVPADAIRVQQVTTSTKTEAK